MSLVKEQGAVESRTVSVDLPGLSPAINARLTEELRDVIGSDSVRVPVDRPSPSHGDPLPESEVAFATSGWLLGMIGTFVAIVVTGIAVTGITGSWWYAGAALALGIIGLVIIAGTVIRMTGITERPDAQLVADMEARGVAHPEQLFTDMVREFTAVDEDAGSGEHRLTAVEDDHAKASQEQSSAMTPTGGRSQAVGPGE